MTWFLQMPQGPAVFLSNEEMSLVNKVKDSWVKKSHLKEREQILAYNLVSRGILSKKSIEDQIAYKYLGKFPGFKKPVEQISELKNLLNELHNGDDGFNGSLTDDPKSLSENFDEMNLYLKVNNAIEALEEIGNNVKNNSYDNKNYSQNLDFLKDFFENIFPLLLKKK